MRTVLVGILAVSACYGFIPFAWYEPTAHAQLHFVDATSESGLVCNHPAGQYGQYGGVAVADFNRDEHLDVFVLCAGELLYINDGAGHFTDQAAQWGLTGGYIGIGAAAADYNGDGWIDIYITSFGPVGQRYATGQHRLYQNNQGQSFTNVAQEAGVRYTSYITPGGEGAAWGDYDLDGDLDLFVTQWFSGDATQEMNRLYRNNGDGTFIDVTATALGVLSTVRGFQPVFADMNNDRLPELLIAADYETSRYFINNGDGTFTNYTIPGGLGLDDNGMGTTVGDLNNDLKPDWYVTSIHYGFPVPGRNPGNMLYINQGNNQFVEASHAAGVNDGGWGWGTIAADFDHDGWLDIVEVNGHGTGTWINEQAYLFRNTTTQAGVIPSFQETAIQCGMEHRADQTSVVAFDADNDGDLDVLSYATGTPMKFFKNTTINPGAWLEIVFDTSNNPQLAPEGYGTRIEVTCNESTVMRLVDGCPSFLATSGAMVHFGLGDGTVIDTLRVKWTRGFDSVYKNVAVNQRLVIVSPPYGDVTGDGTINTADLLDLFSKWGQCSAPPNICTDDLNNDGGVNVFDLFILLANWG